jgi:diguanylate cyclase (GGDEF)-like protein/PAS domain S-box-containing protein
MAMTPRGRWAGNLALRALLVSALVVLACVGVTTALVLQRAEQRSEQAVLEQERVQAGRTAALLGQRVVQMQLMLRAAATALPAPARTDATAAADFLADKPGLLTTFPSLFIADAAGAVLALHDGSAVSQPALDLADRDYFRQSRAGGLPVVSAPLPGQDWGEPVIMLTMPVFDAQGGVAAVIGGPLRLGSRNLLDELGGGGRDDEPGARTLLTDSRGILIAHPRRQRVLAAIETEPDLAAAVSRWVAQGRPMEPDASSFHDGGHFIAMAAVPGPDWLVFRALPDAGWLAGVAQARRTGLAWAGGVSAAGLVALAALLGWLLRPLTRLQRRARRVHDPQLALDQGWPAAGGAIGEISQALQGALGERAQADRARQALARQMDAVLQAAPVGIAFTRGQRFERVGAEFGAMLGWADGALVGQPAREVLAQESGMEAMALQVVAAPASGRNNELQLRRRDGSTFWGRLQGRAVHPDDSEEGTIWLLEDVTAHREARARLSWSARHDMLTRLLNRGAFEERLAEWLRSRRPGVPASLLYVDLDHFKKVNDCAGHAAGDAVLRDVASVLQAQVRSGDAAARLGGDEFALLLPGCVAPVALQIGARLRAAIAGIGVEHGGGRMTVSASVGVVEIDPAAAGPASTWLARADAACYEAKQRSLETVLPA